MPFNTTWTVEGLETAFWFWSSSFPLLIANTGVNGDGMATSLDDSASNFLELEIPWSSKSFKQIMIIKTKKYSHRHQHNQ